MAERRTAALLGGGAVLGGAVVMLVALVAAPGPWLQGYVSEAGTAGMQFAAPYRYGLVVLACGVALIGLAVRPWSGLLTLLLSGSAVFAATSGVVPCSNQCPLPPYEPTTVNDVVHTAASIAGLLILAGAMVLVAFSSSFRPATRRLSVVAAALLVPLGAALGLTMLLIGRGPLGAVLERIALLVAVSWLVGLSLLTLLRSSVKVKPWIRHQSLSNTGSPRSRSGSRS
ncbi:DUF998 domain-containing protein [Actinoplanes friuliensis]|uniref:DUF998 domain-containing protein n=1 Tax=Actinoplanes friuliensis TaxID=196914 RepID=UPI000694EFB9|nr:DUF998 domain-containing protein [Actinoplanes friuliensis]